jgi:hypothetical protein
MTCVTWRFQQPHTIEDELATGSFFKRKLERESGTLAMFWLLSAAAAAASLILAFLAVRSVLARCLQRVLTSLHSS